MGNDRHALQGHHGCRNLPSHWILGGESLVIPLNTLCLLMGRRTPDCLFGYPCTVVASFGAMFDRYTVKLSDGRLLRCNSAALMPLHPLPDESSRLAGLKLIKGDLP